MMELIAWYADEMECLIDDLVHYVCGCAASSTLHHVGQHVRQLSGVYKKPD